MTSQDLETIKSNVHDERLSLKTSSAIDLSAINNDEFDVVMAWEVVEHIPLNTENLMFSEVNRVLKTGGKFYVSTPNSSFFSNLFDPAWWLVGHRHYSLSQLVNFGRNNGFEVSKYMVVAGWWSLLFTLNMYISKWIFRRKPFFRQFFIDRDTSEYLNEGFANIFIKFKKVK